VITEGFLVEAVLFFNRFVILYFLALNSIYLVLFLVSLGEVRRFVRRTFFSDYREIEHSELTWPISVIVPAHDEERTIVETVRSLLRVNYSEFEIIVVNDGSDDATLARLIESFELRRVARVSKRELATRHVRGVWGSLVHPNLFVIDKERGGKPDALNAGINLARYPLFCSIDADSLIEDDALLRIVKPFMEHPEETVAAGGIVRVANGCIVRDGRVEAITLPDRPLVILQALEYLRAFLAGRVGWNALRSLLIISGAFGVYRKDKVIEIGGYSDATCTEDLELIVRLRRHLRESGRPYRMTFVPDPVCWTEVPVSLSTLARQRTRWHRGLIQTLLANRGMLFNPRHGMVGLAAMPYFFLFEMLGPFVEVAGYLAVFLSWVLGLLDREFFLLFLTVSVLYGIFLSIAAVLLEEISFRRYPRWVDLGKLVVYSVIENLGYRQLLSLFKIKAIWDLLTRRRAWGRMPRAGFRTEPAREGIR
jgi:cellulose synthase/poly-beta-1,6-N-acetylglucosamine synthase-like glycosyltransferase